MPAINHTHSYERVGSRNRSKVWRCTHPDCTHTMPSALISGKRSTCTCGETFIIDAGAMQRRRPKCLNCRDTVEGRKHQRITGVLDDVLGTDLPVREVVEKIRSAGDSND